MTISKINYPGAFMFDKNLPLPETGPDAGEQVSFTFGVDWLPYVLGALVALTRPETWDADGSDLAAVMRDAEELLTMWDSASAGAPSHPNWSVAIRADRYGQYDFGQMPDPGLPNDDFVYFANVSPDLSDFIDVTFRGFPVGSFTQTVGGLWSKFVVTSEPIGTVSPVTVFLTDCFGAVSSDTNLCPYVINNFTGKSIRVVCSHAINIEILTHGNWICGAA